VIALAQSTFAIIVVIALFGLFVLMLMGSFMRARRSSAALVTTPQRPGGVPAPPPAAPKARAVLSRRDFFRGGLLASLMVFAAQFGGASLAFLWPNLKGGFGALITLPDNLDTIKNQIQQQRQPYYFGAGRFYLEIYTGDGANTDYAGLISNGLMAIYQKCAHLGCRVPFCEQSQWFECPCHGSKYNKAGEYQLGPAPTGLSHFAVKVDGSTVKVDTSNIVPGPPRGTNTIHQSPEGPFCVGGAAGG